MQFAIIKRSGLWLIIGLVLTALATWLFLTNLRFSVQFTGGMEVVVDKPSIDESVVEPALTTALQEKGFTDFELAFGQKDGYGSVLIQMSVDDNNQVTEVTDLVQGVLADTKTIESDTEILELSIIGPSVGEYIQKTAKSALIRGMILMGIYILFAFSGMRGMISPLLLGGVTIITMIFDIAVASGAYGILMEFNQAVQVDTIFIIALLTVMGYSINDTIVIFDRLRENFIDKRTALEKGQADRAEIFESSLWQTMRRSLATGAATMGVIIIMWFFGTGLLKMFAFTLGVGILSGTYSSIFIAAPLVYLLSGKGKKIATKK